MNAVLPSLLNPMFVPPGPIVSRFTSLKVLASKTWAKVSWPLVTIEYRRSGVHEFVAGSGTMPPMPGSSKLSRRALLLGLGAFTLGQWRLGGRAAASSAVTRTSGYRVDISMLWGVLRYSVVGNMVEDIDAESGRYRVLITGSGTGVSSRIEVRGLIEQGRYRPLEMKSTHSLAGRESWLSITYDYDRGLVDYHAVGHTLLLGRRRQVDDLVRLPAGRPVDDAVSIGLNLAAGHLERDAAGTYQTSVLRRSRPVGEGPDDVTPGSYRVEVVPFLFRVEPDPRTGKLVARVDMSGWSSWARPDQPAHLVFTPDRRLESVESRLVFGSTVRMQLT